jgi:hypothetical protein
MSYSTIPPTYEQSQAQYDQPPPYYEEVDTNPQPEIEGNMTEEEKQAYWDAIVEAEEEEEEEEDDSDDDDDEALLWQQQCNSE